MELNYDKLFEMVIKDIPIKSENKLYGISFIGAPGIGKSTVSKILSEKLGIYVTANDKIRRLLDEVGINASDNQALVERLASDRTVYMLKNNTSMIIDANMLTAYTAVEENFNKYNSKCLFIKLNCSEEEILNRIAKRKTEFGKTGNFSRATEEDYYKYKHNEKENKYPKEKIFYTIDTEKDIEKQINELIIKIKKKFK